MAKIKPNSENINDFLTTLKNSSFLPKYIKWWPKYLFHFSDINNIISILETNHLYSRNLAIKKDLLIVDIASEEVISKTKYEIKNFVRLYFRPKTPTQYRNEGIRPLNQREIHSHCPVPIYLMFDSASILSLPNSKFSKGNLAKKDTSYTDDIKKLYQFPFNLIYHDSFFHDEIEKKRVIRHRNAEVIIPKSLNLDSLKLIVCRSEAEKDTLLNLLNKNSWLKWNSKISVDRKNYLFCKEWTYVEKAIMGSNYIILDFPPDSKTPGPFTLKLERRDLITDELISGKISQFMCEGRKRINFKQDSKEYSIKIFLDNDMAYWGFYDYDDLPF